MKKSLKRKLDILFSQYMRKKIGECQFCRKKDNLQIHHIYSRNRLSVRWDENNILVLCPQCHFWAHQNPVEFVERLHLLLGDKLETLKKKANTIYKFSDTDLEDLIFFYQKQLNS